MEILALVVCMLIGVVVGWHLREQYAMRIVSQMLKEIEVQHPQEEQGEDRTPMRLEKHNDVIYAFTSEDDSFIAQGKSLEDLDVAIQARFPGKKFSIKEKNLEEIGIVP